MPRRKRQVHLTVLQCQQSNVYFNIKNEDHNSCAICFRETEHPIRPCLCNTVYHEGCLLLLIQRKIIHEIRKKEQMSITTLKCMTCNNRFYLRYAHQTYRSCQTLCQKLRFNCFNKYIVLLIIILAAILITVVLCFLFISNESYKNNNKVKYGLISASVIQVLLFVLFLYLCLQSHLTVRKFILYKVYDMMDPEIRSLQSQNSDELRVSQDEQVIIQE